MRVPFINDILWFNLIPGSKAGFGDEEGRGAWETGEGELDELTPGLQVSQGASMQGMLPDSPWYWLVSRPGIHLPHPPFTLSVVEGGEVGSGLGVCVCVCLCVHWGQLVLGLTGVCGGGVTLGAVM